MRACTYNLNGSAVHMIAMRVFLHALKVNHIVDDVIKRKWSTYKCKASVRAPDVYRVVTSSNGSAVHSSANGRYSAYESNGSAVHTSVQRKCSANECEL